jgi:hypothetical protein
VGFRSEGARRWWVDARTSLSNSFRVADLISQARLLACGTVRLRAKSAGRWGVDARTSLACCFGVADLISKAGLVASGTVGLRAEGTGRRRIDAIASLSCSWRVTNLYSKTLNSRVNSKLSTDKEAQRGLTGFLQAEQSVFVPRVQEGGGSTQVPAFPGAEVWQI